MALSYSAIGTFKKCAFRYKLSYIEKLPRTPMDPNSAGGRGLRIHQTIEDFTNRVCEEIDPEIRKAYGQYFLTLREQGLEAEIKWGLLPDWTACDFDDPAAMLRGVIDGKLKPNIIYEYKTGKFYPEHFEQMMLYGMVELLTNPQPHSVSVTALYLDSKAHRTIDYYRSMLDNYKSCWYIDIMKVLNEKSFAPNPSYACRWCDFSKQNGGPCAF